MSKDPFTFHASRIAHHASPEPQEFMMPVSRIALLAIEEALDGKVVDSMEQVSDLHYRK